MRYLSVFNEDEEILKAISDIHLKGKWFDLDCTYSKGVFYKNIEKPKYKSDLHPQCENNLFECDIKKANSNNLYFLNDKSISSIVFDPPFLFRNRKSKNNDKISKRFTCFDSWEELKNMYNSSLKEFNRVLKKNGYVFFKCQDMTDGNFYATHIETVNFAKENGFVLKDIIIKHSNRKLQRDAKQQNCVAKTHSYWLVFKKKEEIMKQAEYLETHFTLENDTYIYKQGQYTITHEGGNKFYYESYDTTKRILFRDLAQYIEAIELLGGKE